MVIDEMNRANLPKVFGELMYLFEYRDSAIDLQYSRGSRLPDGPRFIGTMNTADRSIRSIDVALRRRFDIFDCPPDAGMLQRYYERSATTRSPELIEGFERLNERPDGGARPPPHHRSHVLDGQTARRGPPAASSGRHKIGPLIEEYFFDQPDIADQYRLERFWPSLG